jgi:hypothetical protein
VTRSVVAYLAFALGACVSLLNFYLSWIRAPLFRALGRSPQWVSGLPLIGSLLLAISAALLWQARGLAVTALVLAAIDTGGIHWFLGGLLWQAIGSRQKDHVE